MKKRPFRRFMRDHEAKFIREFSLKHGYQETLFKDFLYEIWMDVYIPMFLARDHVQIMNMCEFQPHRPDKVRFNKYRFYTNKLCNKQKAYFKKLEADLKCAEGSGILVGKNGAISAPDKPNG